MIAEVIWLKFGVRYHVNQDSEQHLKVIIAKIGQDG